MNQAPTGTQEERRNGWDERITRLSDFVTESFGSFIYSRPITVMFMTLFLSVTLMALGIKFSQLPDFSEPTKGFETRNTELSARVVTWTKLYKTLSIYPDPAKPYFRQLQQALQPLSEERRRKRDNGNQGKREKADAGGKSFLETFFTSGYDSSPCLQLQNDFDDMDIFSQVIFETPSLDALFSLESMEELCTFQTFVNESLEPIRHAIDYQHFWSLPNYVACLGGLFSCTELTDAVIKEAAKTVKECFPHRDVIISCGTPVDSQRYSKQWYNCSTRPEQCRSKYLYDLYDFILSTNIGEKGASPVYTNMVLSSLQWEAYDYLKKPGVTGEMMVDIYEEIIGAAKGMQRMQVKGVNMGIKFEASLRSFYGDCYYVFAALILVYLVIWLYSGSLFFTLTVFFTVVASMGIAYFVYRLVFRLKFFPLMNLFMIILTIGIGADDAFVLKHIFDTSRRKVQPGVALKGPSISKDDMCDALSHTALAMFVCIATTSAAFYSNLVSDIVVIKCFGVFAGITMLINYLLVVTWLPSSLIVLDVYLNPLCHRFVPALCLTTISKIWTAGSLLSHYLLLTVLPRFVMLLKYLWITIFGLLFLAACVVVFYQPGVALPTNNPMQMFRPSHPFEWYDNKAGDYFSFIQTRYNGPIEIVLVIGIKAHDDNAAMDPNDYETPLHTGLQLNPEFHLNVSFLKDIDDVCQRLQQSDIVNSFEGYQCFTEQFFKWSKKQHCHNISDAMCCNVSSPWFREGRDLIRCLAESTKVIDAMTGGPIFRVSDMKAVDGFLLFFDANRSISSSYTTMKEFFTDVEQGVKEAFFTSANRVIRESWMTTTFYEASLWYDLQQSLLRGTPISILVSAGVALVVAAVTMRAFVLSVLSVVTVFAVNVVVIASLILLGWHLNIVEATLIVLTVGLAFDFTLKYAVAYQLSPKGGREQKVSTVLHYMGMPVFLAFLTTFLAGLLMLPSSIMAYYQIGQFMVLVSTVSWLYSAFFFLSLLAAFGPEECEWTLMKNMMPKALKQVFGPYGSVSDSRTSEMNELRTAVSPEAGEQTRTIRSHADEQ